MDLKEAKEILRSVAEGGSCDMTELAVHVVLEEFERLEGFQTPKKPIVGAWDPARCPSCDCILSEPWGDGYYKHYTNIRVCDCGQKLDWGDKP
jgi:hypothetical protein